MHQAFANEPRREEEIPRSNQVFNALADYSAFSTANFCDGLPRLHAQQYSMSNSAVFDDSMYQVSCGISSHEAMTSANHPQHTYQFAPTAQLYNSNSSPTSIGYQNGLTWYGKHQSIHEPFNDVPTSSYDPRDLTLASTMPSVSPLDGATLPPSDFDSPTNDSVLGFGRLSIVDGIRFEELPSMQDFEIKKELGSDCASSKHSDDEEGDGIDLFDTTDDRIIDEPYAKLIFRALMAAPGHSMALQEIYQWFGENTDKCKPGQNGWRNSIRHNLSMNAAFNKLYPKPVKDESKKNSVWVLDREALHKGGVAPTTRYRKSSKKSLKSQTSARPRKMAGSCGGKQASSNRSKLQQMHDATNALSNFSSSQNIQQAFDNTRHCSSMPDGRHLSPSTPTGMDFPPIVTPYFKKPTPFLELSDQSQYIFNDGTGLYLDNAPVFCGDEVNAQQWSGGYDF